MKFFILLYSLVFCVKFGAAFFLFPEKQAIFLCVKFCPLYCVKRSKRDADRYWHDSDVYNWPPTYYEEEEEDHPYPPYPPTHGGWWVYCPITTTPKPTTTTMATTTEEPTWICEVCQKKCGTRTLRI